MGDKVLALTGGYSGELTFDYISDINFAMCHNSSPAIVRCQLQNSGTTPWHNIQITVSGDALLSDSLTIDSLAAETTADITKQLKLRPNPDELIRLQEGLNTLFTLTVSIDGEQALSQQLPLHLMPYDHWTGITERPELLSAFVTPNHPLLSRVIVAASKFMYRWTGNQAMDEYQSGDPNRVRLQVAAIYEALRGEGLVYTASQPSFEQTGQRIRTVEKVLTEKIGNCLDLTLLFASCLEAVSIQPILVMLQGHCLVGAWLTSHDNCMVGDDVSLLLKSAADGLNELVLVESTLVTNAEGVSFDDAVRAAMDALRDEKRLICYINVDDCRLNHILPIPIRVQEGDRWVIVNDSDPHAVGTISVRRYDRYDLSAYDTDSSKVTKYTIWERKLLDFSLRNNLLNMRLGKKVIPLVSFNIDRLEDALEDGQTFKVLPFPLQEPVTIGANGIPDSSAYPQLEETATNGLSNKRIYSFHKDDELKEAMKYAYRAARTSLEENGASNLYLVLGLLRWYETDRSQQPRLAPILLLPIEIRRGLGRTGYDIRSRDEEIVLNITLTELLKQQHGIDLSALNELPKDESGVDVKKILAIVRDKIRDKRGWNVLDESMIGLFSFSKFVMWNDIHTNAPLLYEHPIISSLVDGKLNITDETPTADAKTADSTSKPEEYAIPIDVDSSQLEAIIDAGSGHSFILHGPPGTGKSQTITNIIANAMYQGKRVLFVAEKMAALEVVQARLERIGLAPFCLELHSNKATKQHFLKQMEDALNVAHLKSPADYARESEQLFEARKTLIAYVEALHSKGANGLSLYDYITSYTAIKGEMMDIDIEKFGHPSRREIDEMCEKICHLDTVMKITGSPATSPLNGLSVTDGSAKAEAMLKAEITACHKALNALAAIPAYKQAMPLCLDPELLKQAQDTLAAAATVIKTRDEMADRYGQNVLNTDLQALAREWQMANDKWLLPRYFARRSVLKRMAMTVTDIKYLIACNDKITQSQRVIRQQGTDVQELLGINDWSGAADMRQGQRLAAACAEVSAHIDAIRKAADIDVTPDTLIESIDHWSKGLDQIRTWYHWCESCRMLHNNGLSCVTEYIVTANHTADEAADAFAKGLYRALAIDAINSEPTLRHFNGLLFEDAIAKYRDITAKFQELSKKELYCRLAARIPSLTMAAHDTSEVGIIMRNIKNKGRGTSIRKIIDQIPVLLPKLCPCMLMSPLSVAQYIDLKNEKFDLVIFDEASQMPTSEAVGAIARGKALVVVGDPKQMPPTSFFATSAVGEDEAHIDDMESVLDDCLSLSIPSKFLTWHYRSKHESLIAFSNSQYYGGNLYTFPSVDDHNRKVTLRYVQGVYDKGHSRSNINEAREIVQEVIRRLSDPQQEHMSIGIVSFSKVQQDKIEDLLNDELAKHPELESKAYNSDEPIFVKNLENVQGDERDVILFSVGYGPDKDGRVSMNFGPLNNTGGERRLNVAVSRARYEMVVFSSLHPEQIDLRRTNALGVEGLKRFLEFAEKGTTSLSVDQAQADADDCIAAEIAEALQQHGYRTQLKVGRSKFKIDIAVYDPENEDEFMLGILCDGANYHETKTMRDREIVQPSVLKALSWKIMRVWTLDWFERRDTMLSRILQRLDDIRAGVDAPATPTPAAPAAPVTDGMVEITAPSPGYEYVTAKDLPTGQPVASADELLSQERLLKRQLKMLIEQEQPITSSLIYKRIVKLWGLTRITPKLQGLIDNLLKDLHLYSYPNGTNGTTYWMKAADAEAFTGFRIDSGRDIADVPYVEIENAMRFVLEQQMALDKEDLKRLTANQLGYSRKGTNIDSATEYVLALMQQQGRVSITDTKVSLS